MPEITVYSRTTCAPCQTVKTWLKSKNIPYIEKIVDDKPEYAREAFEFSGHQIVPVIVVGDQVITGPNFGLMSRLLTSNQ